MNTEIYNKVALNEITRLVEEKIQLQVLYIDIKQQLSDLNNTLMENDTLKDENEKLKKEIEKLKNKK